MQFQEHLLIAYLNKVINGVPDETVIEGTIDLEEDGTALMKFISTIEYTVGT